MSGDAHDFNKIEALAVKFFFCKARSQRKFMPFCQKHQGNMHGGIPPLKTGWPILNVVIFPPVLHLILDDSKQ
jgi:hypothetical protein